MRYLLIVLVLLCFSCKKETLCENQKTLFQYTNAKTISIDLNNNYDKVKTQIKSQYEEDFCNSPEFNFSYNYKGKEILLPFKVFDCPSIMLHPNMITFLFNKEGDFLIESEIVDKVNISGFIKESIIKERERRETKTFFLSFELNNKIDDNIFNQVLENSLDGIMLYYEDLAIKNFSKEFCQLTPEEIQMLSSKFQFAFTSSEVFKYIPRLPEQMESKGDDK